MSDLPTEDPELPAPAAADAPAANPPAAPDLPPDSPPDRADPQAPAVEPVVAAEPALPEEPASAETPAAAAPPSIPNLSPAACAARLAELYPAVFTPGAAKPLKLRIQADIQQRSPGIFSRKTLSLFLQRHTTSTAYLRALARQPERIDLDGGPAGEVSEEHRSAAATEVQRRHAVHEERRQAERLAQRQAEREAHELARRQQAADYAAQDEARRHRAGLLRAFETTTLTRANFCALKMLPESELDALLVQARSEREQAPRPMPLAERPATRPPGRDAARPGDRPDRPPGDRAPARPGERTRRPDGARGPRRGGASTGGKDGGGEGGGKSSGGGGRGRPDSGA